MKSLGVVAVSSSDLPYMEKWRSNRHQDFASEILVLHNIIIINTVSFYHDHHLSRANNLSCVSFEHTLNLVVMLATTVAWFRTLKYRF